MKRKKLYKLLFILIFLELAAIIGIKGYAIIRDTITDSAMENASKSGKKNKKNKNTDSTKDSDLNTSSSENNSSNENLSDEPSYDFTTVEDSYFDDALFIGDSRTVGLRTFGHFPNSYFFAKTGISVNSLFEHPAADEATGLSLSSTLVQRKYSKVYLMIGVNDLAYGTLTEFSDSYFNAVEKIKVFQPDALIYVQSIVGITQAKELSSPRGFNNQTVINRNAMLKSKCDEKNVFYLDLFSAFKNDLGYLDSKYSSDGLHINPDSLSLWEDYLKTHAIQSSK